MDGAVLYKRLRTGRTFLIFISTFVAIWIIWNSIGFLPHFDDAGFPLLTLILSVEASIGTSVLMAATEKQDAQNEQQLKYMLHLIESHISLSESMSEKMGIDIKKGS